MRNHKLKNSIFFLFSYWMMSLLLFLLLQKPIFMFYNWHHGGAACSLSDWISIYQNGLILDIATASYLVVLPFLGMWIWYFLSRFSYIRFIKIYSGILAVILALGTCADAALYEFWDFKLDATVFLYITDPKNAFASVSALYILVALLSWAALSVVYYLLLTLPTRFILLSDTPRSSYQSITYSAATNPSLNRKNILLACGCYLVIGGLVFAGIRGLRIWPNTPGVAFFSKTTFHNHAALNPIFNVVYTTTKKDNYEKEFRFYPEAKRASLMQDLFPTSGTPTTYFVSQKRPNILVIVLEGFASCFIENLGGMKDVAPQFSRWSHEGVLFSNCYCGSFRTDRGIVCAISGYLGQPTMSIMRYTRKVRTLPGLPKTLKKYGYTTQMLYGGDASFFNMSDYILASGHDKIISQTDFPADQLITKWGVPDHLTFDWLYKDIQDKYRKNQGPWYTTFLTISSHTPFDVPYHRLKDKKLNAFAYTDSCIGNFLDKLKKSPAWKNLLVVCVADHGYNHEPITSPKFPYIPLFFTGGAITHPQRIEKYVSQTDLPATLLGQLGIPHSEFTFSRDVMADTYRYPFGFNTFNNGFNIIDSTGCTVHDNVSNKNIYGNDARREAIGKAILQTLYEDITRR